MYRVLILALMLSTFFACNKVDLKKTCQGEWAFFINDTSYCEVLINDSIVFPYHYGARNGVEFHYKISQDSFYLFSNEADFTEASPIKYLGPDSFKILAITPTTLHRVKYEKGAKNSLAMYHYKSNKLLRNKPITQIIEQRIFPQIDELRKLFEKKFNERRELALYKKQKRKQ